jgi:hypothetical protein
MPIGIFSNRERNEHEIVQEQQDKKANCMNCASRTTASGGDFCTKDVPTHINVRQLSDEGVKRLCTPLPEERICSGNQPVLASRLL